MASEAALRIRPSDLDSLWARSEPDLELDQDGRIRPVPTESSDRRGSAVGAAAPIALGALVSSVARWD
jgi:hypothetical protein